MVSEESRVTAPPAGKRDRLNKIVLSLSSNPEISTENINTVSTFQSQLSSITDSTNTKNSSDDVFVSNIKHIQSSCQNLRHKFSQVEARSKPSKMTFSITPYVPPINNKINHDRSHLNSSKYDTFGDQMDEKGSGHIRIVSQNINCLGVRNSNNSKQDRAINWLINNEVDIIGWQELGIAFHLLPYSHRLAARLKDPRWMKQRVSSNNNKHENVEKFQYGGTSLAAFDEAAHRVSATGGDSHGLGRWSWILFHGKHNYRTRILSAYVPCKSSCARRKTVYNQQKRYFMSKGILDCPRSLFISHITEKIQKWQRDGENIVLLIDLNEDLTRMGPLQSALVYDCHLVDPIRAIYQQNNKNLPPTSLTGSVPIDVSITISTKRRMD